MKYEYKDTLFPVVEEAIKVEGLVNSTDYKFVIRPDTNKVISCMTSEYKLVTNEEVMEKANPILKEQGAVLSNVNIFGEGARTSYRYRFPKIKIKVPATRSNEKDELLNPEVIIKNSYDGSCQIGVIAGAFRLVCSNGLTIGKTFASFNNKHSIWNKNLDRLEETIGELIQNSIHTMEYDIPNLQNIEINPIDISKLIEMFPSNVMEEVTNYLITNPPKTYWDLLNAATWTATHQLNRGYESTHKIEEKIYPQIMKLSKSQTIAES